MASGSASARSPQVQDENPSCNDVASFKAADTVVQQCESRKPKPESENLSFGTVFTDHMLLIEWSSEGGWEKPRIQPFGNLSLHPACSALHYAVQLFEGMKAYRGQDDRVRLFRPMLNMERMLKSAHRACLPSFDGAEFLECIRKLVELDQDWVSRSDSASLYIRPTFLGTEVSDKTSTASLSYHSYQPPRVRASSETRSNRYSCRTAYHTRKMALSAAYTSSQTSAIGWL